MTPPEPLRLTLAEAIESHLSPRKWWVDKVGDNWCIYTPRPGQPPRLVMYGKSWPEAVSIALGVPVVERDEAAELREAALRACEALMTCRYALDRNNKSGWFDIEVRVADDSIAALRRLVGMGE